MYLLFRGIRTWCEDHVARCTQQLRGGASFATARGVAVQRAVVPEEDVAGLEVRVDRSREDLSPRAVKSLSADLILNVLKDTYAYSCI